MSKELEQMLDNDIKKGYQVLLDEKNILAILELENFRGIKPVFNENVAQIVQEYYSDFFEKGLLNAAINLKKATGMHPSYEVIQNAYDVFFKRFKYRGLPRALELRRLCGVNPGEEIAEKYPYEYKQFISSRQ